MKLLNLKNDTPIGIYFRIAFISNHYRDQVNRIVEKKYGLTRSEFALLFCLNQIDYITASDVTEFTQLPKNSISRGVAILINKELATSVKDPNNRRKNILKITSKGKKLAKNISGHLVEANTRLTSSLTDEEAQTLEFILEKICVNTSPKSS